MIDLFADIPEETVETTLRMIRGNLNKVGLYGGHTLRRHTDIQVLALKARLTQEDIRYATSFWDMEIAMGVAWEIMRQFYDEEISYWLKDRYSDVLPLVSCFPKTIGYGFKKGEERLEENLRKACLVLAKDPQADWGFRILTSYPMF